MCIFQWFHHCWRIDCRSVESGWIWHPCHTIVYLGFIVNINFCLMDVPYFRNGLVYISVEANTKKIDRIIVGAIWYKQNWRPSISFIMPPFNLRELKKAFVSVNK
jgi:hypothetical protein